MMFSVNTLFFISRIFTWYYFCLQYFILKVTARLRVHCSASVNSLTTVTQKLLS